MERKVIHLNIADFSVAVERLIDSTLRQTPLIIAPQTPRAVVYDMSEEAYLDGVRKGMMLGQAKRLCKKATVLPPRQEKYQHMLVKCFVHARQFSPLVECSDGNGHLYLDVTGTHRLFGPPPDIGWRLRKILRQDLGLDPIWSLAPNKLVAKVGSRLVKPSGEYIVAAGEEAAFLAPLPIHLIPGISPVDLQRLRDLHISKVRQAAALNVQELSIVCGNRARAVYQAVRGIDQTPVQSHQGSRDHTSFTVSHTFSPDTNDSGVVRSVIGALAAQTGYTLRERNLACRGIGISLLYTDGQQIGRQATEKQPTVDDHGLEQLALTALYRAWHRRVRLRRITLSCLKVCIPAQQLSLFDHNHRKKLKNKQLSSACDALRRRYGTGVVQRGMSFTPRTPARNQ